MTTMDTLEVYVQESGEDMLLSSAAVRELLEAILEKGQHVRFRAGGMSMFPFILNGDVATIAPLDRRGLRPGDIVAFLHPSSNSLTLHRLIGVENDYYEIRGDSAMQPDGKIPLDNILGKVIRVERKGRDVRMGVVSGGRAIAFMSRRGMLGRVATMIIHVLALYRRTVRPGQYGLKQDSLDREKNRNE